MTLTQGLRQAIAVALVVLAAAVLLVWGNQRQAHAFDFFSVPISGGDIVDTVECILDAHPPADVFDIPGCQSAGGQIDWCPNIDDIQTIDELPCIPPPVPQCSDGVDNEDFDHLADEADPNCHTDGDASNSDSYDPDSSEEGTTFECLDGIDNDHDGKTDWNPLPGQGDPDCATPLDNSEQGDEAPLECDAGYHVEGNACVEDTQEPLECDEGYHLNDDQTECVADEDTGGDTGGGDEGTGGSSGGSHHSSGGGHIVNFTNTGGEVLGTSTEVADCSKYLTSYIHFGRQNETEQVLRLQRFLRDFEHANVSETGTYDETTMAAVNAFQQKYATDVLTPWGITNSTGYVYFTTQKKVNEIYCAYTKQFPLSQQQWQVINQTRANGGVVMGAQTSEAPHTGLTAPPLNEGGTDTTTSGSANVSGNGGTQSREVDGQPRGFWGSIGNLFGRLFGR